LGSTVGASLWDLRQTEPYWDKFQTALLFPSGGIAYHKDKNDYPQTKKCSTAIGQHRAEKESDIDFRASDNSSPLILLDSVFDAKHKRVLNEMFLSISLCLVYGHRINMRREGKGQTSPLLQYIST
jgi:hypothetical protein